VKKALASAVISLAILVGASDLAAGETQGAQDFLVVFSGSGDSPGTVVAIGALTSVGIADTPEGQRPTPFPAVFTFPDGSLFLTISPTHNGLEYNPQTCVLSGPIFGTYAITGGTAQLAGASGSGTFEGHVFALFGRDAQGRCSSPESEPPIFGVQVIRNPGTISLPEAAAA
jgi:hypothetical protein